MTRKKISPTPDREKIACIDKWIDDMSHTMLTLALKNRYRYVLPELMLSCLMSADELSSYYERAFTRATGSINLKAFIKQLNSYIIKFSPPIRRGQKSAVLTEQFTGMMKILKRYMLEFGPSFAPSLLPVAIMELDSCFGGDLLRAAGLNAESFLDDIRQMQDAMQDDSASSEDECVQSGEDALFDISDNGNEDNDDDSDVDLSELLANSRAERSSAAQKKSGRYSKNSCPNVLRQFSIELVEEARQGKLESLVGRDKELESLITILNQKHANNALIIGNEGIGKTALAEGLAWRISEGTVPKSMRDFRIFSLNLGAMLAGCELRGAFEKRLTAVIEESISLGSNIIFLDEIHTIIGAGTGRDGTLDASNILKPYLSRGELRCIGATTYDEYQKRFLVDRAFARRFSKIELNEPNCEETLQIIQGLAPAYAAYHKVKYDDKILEQIVTLADRYITGRYFPDKAITVMDKCGALYRSGVLQGRKVKSCDVERIICQIANLPSLNAENNSDRIILANLESELKKEIYGQDEAVNTLVKHIKVAKAGFHDPRKPLVSAFLCGSSGCGKTELARKIAEKLGITFLKFDMSEYSEEYAASRLIGSAPGYVGYDSAGALTEPVIQNPHCVLLLDEIEKAHRVVFNMLLQVLDDGKLTDNKGRVASFKNAIILMTSNAGSQDATEAIDRLGFNRGEAEQLQNRQEIMDRTIRKIFPPEFRNRLQCHIMMNNLDDTALRSVVRKTVRNAAMLLTNPEITLDISDEAVGFIAELAARENMGGRPVERLVDTLIKQQLVDELLFGELRNGGKASISVHPNGVELSLAYCKSAAVSA